jgi:hypothetical protein
MRSKMDLQHASQHFRLLSDSTRLRLLMLVDSEGYRQVNSLN